jgi:hypothetical protein
MKILSEGKKLKSQNTPCWRISHKEHEGREEHKEEFQHAQYDLYLKHLIVVQAGGLRGGKTKGESDSEPATRSLRRGVRARCYS